MLSSERLQPPFPAETGRLAHGFRRDPVHTLLESGSGKTAIHAHLEKLPDADTREAMRKRWCDTLERIATAAP